MSINQINAEIPQETEDLILENIETSISPLDCWISLQALERIRLAKMARKDLDFVERTLMHAVDNPQYLNNYVTLEEFGKDVDSSRSLRRFNAGVDALKQKINDTRLVVEAEAYSTARVFYKSVKAAAQEGVPGAEAIAADLAIHFKRRPAPKEEKKDTETPAEPQQ